MRDCDVANGNCDGYGRYLCYACGSTYCCSNCSAIRPWRSLRGGKWALRPHRICDNCWEQAPEQRYVVTETWYATYFVEARSEEEARQIVNRIPTGCSNMERAEQVEIRRAERGVQPNHWYTIEDVEDAGLCTTCLKTGPDERPAEHPWTSACVGE